MLKIAGRNKILRCPSNPTKINLRKLKRIALRKTDNMIDAVITYENMLEDLKKGFKI